MPHRPKPPTAISWPSRTTPASAAAALGKILFIADSWSRTAKIISAGALPRIRAGRSGYGRSLAAGDARPDRRRLRQAAAAARRDRRARRGDAHDARLARARPRRWSVVRAGDHGCCRYRDAAGDDRAAGGVQADDDGAIADELSEAGAEGLR